MSSCTAMGTPSALETHAQTVKTLRKVAEVNRSEWIRCYADYRRVEQMLALRIAKMKNYPEFSETVCEYRTRLLNLTKAEAIARAYGVFDEPLVSVLIDATIIIPVICNVNKTLPVRWRIGQVARSIAKNKSRNTICDHFCKQPDKTQTTGSEKEAILRRARIRQLNSR